MLFEKLNIEQSEIVATLYACWNDCIIEKTELTDEKIIDKVWNNWHLSKQRFTSKRLKKALEWMREQSLVPKGLKGHSLAKPLR
jgi:hypothetical protein